MAMGSDEGPRVRVEAAEPVEALELSTRLLPVHLPRRKGMGSGQIDP
jgi:hypothetical protein